MMKVAIIGATSQSTPALFRALRPSAVARDLKFALAARSVERLNAVLRAIEIVGGGACALEPHDFSRAGLREALTDSDVVVVQIRYGGLQGREFDESFPLDFGVVGDEGLGPGGFSSAWRSWPQLHKMLGLVQEVSPAAQVLLLTSPCSLLTRLANMSWPHLRVRALCELPMTTLLAAAASTRLYDYIGINHLGWLYGIAGRGPIPLKYWRLHEEPQAFQAEQRQRHETRAAELQRLADAALDAYATGTREKIEACLRARPAPWYSDALAPLLESFVTKDSCKHFFLSVANRGRHADFNDEDVLEIPHCWQRQRLVRKPVATPAPQGLVRVLAPFVAYERIAAQAILTRDPYEVEHALAQHPWIGGDERAKALAQAIVADKVLHDADRSRQRFASAGNERFSRSRWAGQG